MIAEVKVHINDFYLFDLSQRGGGIRHNVSQHEIWSHHQVSKQRQHDVGSGDFAPLSITLCKLPDDEDLFLLNKLISLAQLHIDCLYSEGLFIVIYIYYFEAAITIQKNYVNIYDN